MKKSYFFLDKVAFGGYNFIDASIPRHNVLTKEWCEGRVQQGLATCTGTRFSTKGSKQTILLMIVEVEWDCTKKTLVCCIYVFIGTGTENTDNNEPLSQYRPLVPQYHITLYKPIAVPNNQLFVVTREVSLCLKYTKAFKTSVNYQQKIS